MKNLHIIAGVATVVILIAVAIVIWLTLFYTSPVVVPSCTQPKLIIDHDGGADDALAITMALLYEAYFDGPEVVALTTTHGNVNQSQAVINSYRILDLVNRTDVPIYAGVKDALIKEIVSDYYFGYDGLGDTGYVLNKPIEVESLPAAVGLVELAKKYEGQLTVIGIGPLSNIALAIKLDPDFINRIAHLYVGAGDIYDESNPNPEFNADMDPEAYYIVAKASKLGKVTFVPFWKIQSSLNITKEWRSNVLGSINTQTIQTLNSWERISFAASTEWTLLDPAVAAIVLDSSIVDDYKNTSNSIVLCGDQRGINTNHFTGTESNGKLVYATNLEKYMAFLIDVYSAELNQMLKQK